MKSILPKKKQVLNDRIVYNIYEIDNSDVESYTSDNYSNDENVVNSEIDNSDSEKTSVIDISTSGSQKYFSTHADLILSQHDISDDEK